MQTRITGHRGMTPQIHAILIEIIYQARTELRGAIGIGMGQMGRYHACYWTAGPPQQAILSVLDTNDWQTAKRFACTGQS